MLNLKENIKTAIIASHPVVYIQTDEEQEIIDMIKNEANDYILFAYDEVSGLKWLNEESFKSNKTIRIRIKNQLDAIGSNFIDTLSFIQDISKDEKIILVILSVDNIINVENPESHKNIRFIKNLINGIKDGAQLLTMFLISNKLVLPDLIEKDLLVYTVNYPNRQEIRVILEDFLNSNNLILPENIKVEFVSALQGLTKSEIENLLYIALSNDSSLDEKDINLLIDYKKQIVKKNSIIEYVDLRTVNSDMGGLKNLKKWFNRKKEIFKNLDEAIIKGVDLPKGVLLFGMPGCGKSLAAKYASKLLGLPLLRLDMGRVMGPYLGQSEENLRKAIRVSESIAPSILWIDEIEKAFSGIKGSGNDTVIRIFGTLLTWMQEKTKPVFVIATANDITGIPPEFLRKGRFDEIFFVDFPDKEAIKEIFKIQLKKRNKEQYINKIDFNKIIVQMKENFSGADIEAIVSEAVERAFIENRDEISTEDIEKIIKDGIVNPITTTLKEKIEEVRKICKNIAAQQAN